MKIQSTHEVNPLNTGDMQSCFSEHFDLYKYGVKIDVEKFDITTQSDLINPDIPIIIGGGGMLIDGNHSKHLRKIIERHNSKIVLWGIGVNNDYKEKYDDIPSWIFGKALIGIRDKELADQYELDFVPCVSCMNPFFDKTHTIYRDVVCFEGNKLNLPLPTKHCREGDSMEMITNFLGEARSIVTSSYHGMYWGCLMNKEVIVIPNSNSSKFYFFPVKVPHATVYNWSNFITLGPKYDGFLQECRSQNQKFAKKVEQYLGIEIKPKQ